VGEKSKERVEPNARFSPALIAGRVFLSWAKALLHRLTCRVKQRQPVPSSLTRAALNADLGRQRDCGAAKSDASGNRWFVLFGR
jgi:hypothetical protein